MKHKKTLRMILMICVILVSFVACGEGSTKEENETANGNYQDTTDDMRIDGKEIEAFPDDERGEIDGIDDTYVSGENLLSQMQAEDLQYPSQNEEWKYNVYSSYVEITDYLGSATEIAIPEKIENLPVRAIGDLDNAFSDSPLRKVTSVTLPNTIVIIGEGAFGHMFSLMKIDLPEGLIEIGDNAFSGCEQLTELTLPSTVKEIGRSAFRACHFKSIVIPASTEKIGAGAFWDCGNPLFLEEITILNPNADIELSNISSKVICGFAGSTAASYAAKHNATFKVIQ